MKFVIFALIAGIAQAATCTYTLSIYGNNACAGTATTETKYENLPIGVTAATTKLAVTGVGDRYYRLTSCFPTKAFTFAWYSDAAGTTPDKGDTSLSGVGGYWIGAEANKCHTVSSTSYKVSDVSLSGNGYGIGWIDGYFVFFCSTLLFGLC